MSKKIRLLALALAVLMIVPMIFAGCSKDDKKPDTTTPAATDNTSAPATDNTDDSSETTPEKIDLEGYEFHLSTNSYGGLTNVDDKNTHYGTAIYDELLDIYAEIEADLN